jgi:hypothetical protein
MVVLRATGKVLRVLPESASEMDTSDTALGDWYVNRVVVDRRPLLLLVSALSRLAILTLARNVKNLPETIGGLVAQRLERLTVNREVIVAEINAMKSVRVGRTRDRSITGQMVDFAKAVPYYLPVGGWDESTLRFVEDRLGETPCLVTRKGHQTVWPDREAVDLLTARWPSDGKLH